MEMTKTDIVKSVVGWIVAGGTGLIVKGIIENNTEPETLKAKVCITAASIAIGGMAKDATRKYTDAQIDWLIETWNSAADFVKTNFAQD